MRLADLPMLSGEKLAELRQSGVTTVAQLRARLLKGALGGVRVPAHTRAYTLHPPQKLTLEAGLSAGAVVCRALRGRCEVVGSLRRAADHKRRSGSAPPGYRAKDLDVLTTQPLSAVAAALARNSAVDVLDVYSEGEAKWSAIIRVNKKPMALDVFHATAAGWGAAHLHHTGPAQYNIRLRAHARARGYRLNQYGLTPLAGAAKLRKFRTERALLHAIGASWRTPSQRADKQPKRNWRGAYS